MMSNDRYETTLTVTGGDWKPIMELTRIVTKSAPTNPSGTIAIEISRKLISSTKETCAHPDGTATPEDMLALTRIHTSFRAELVKLVKLHDEWNNGDDTWETLMDQAENKDHLHRFSDLMQEMGSIIDHWWEGDSDSD